MLPVNAIDQFMYACFSFIGWLIFLIIGCVVCARLGRLCAITEDIYQELKNRDLK